MSKFPIVLLYRIVTNLIHAYAAELVAREPRKNQLGARWMIMMEIYWYLQKPIGRLITVLSVAYRRPIN